MQTLAAPQQAAPTTHDEPLSAYYKRFESLHPVNGFWGSLEHLARHLALREQFRGIPASLILERLREDGVLVEVPVDPQRANASTRRRVVRASTT